MHYNIIQSQKRQLREDGIGVIHISTIMHTYILYTYDVCRRHTPESLAKKLHSYG